MHRVVAVKLGLLEGQQVFLFNEGVDAALKPRQPDSGNQNAVKLFHQEGARMSRANRSQWDLCRRLVFRNNPAHFANDRIEELDRHAVSRRADCDRHASQSPCRISAA